MLSPGPPSTIFEDARSAVGIMLAVSVIVFGAMLITDATIKLVSNAAVTDQPPSNQHNWLALISFQVGMIALGLAFARAYGALPKVLSLALPSGSPAAVLRRAATTLAAIVGVMAVYSIIAYILFPDAVQKDLAVFQRLLSGVPIWLPIVVLVFGAPLSEELVFRGLMLGRLQETRLGFAGAAVVSTLSWTLLHLSYTLVGLIDVFVAGLLFSWSLWRTQSLWIPIAFHALYNAIVLALISTMAAQPA